MGPVARVRTVCSLQLTCVSQSRGQLLPQYLRLARWQSRKSEPPHYKNGDGTRKGARLSLTAHRRPGARTPDSGGRPAVRREHTRALRLGARFSTHETAQELTHVLLRAALCQARTIPQGWEEKAGKRKAGECVL